jgi:hypothetical protein
LVFIYFHSREDRMELLGLIWRPLWAWEQNEESKLVIVEGRMSQPDRTNSPGQERESRASMVPVNFHCKLQWVSR